MPLVVEPGQHLGVRPLPVAAELVGEVAGEGVVGPPLLGQQPGEALVEHLEVTGLAQQPTQVTQLLAQRLGDLPAQHRPIGRQRAAQPPRGHPHLVHRVGGVATHLRVEGDDPPRLLGDPGLDHLAR